MRLARDARKLPAVAAAVWMVLSAFFPAGCGKKLPEAGATRTIVLPGGVPMEMVWCPPGRFVMGSPERDKDHFENERRHRVTLTQGFWMAKYEVSQEQWRSVMGKFPLWEKWKGAEWPVTRVSWQDCRKFCQQAGNGLQLPTEAQWEYACRAGSRGAYAGTGRLDTMGWYAGNSGEDRQPVGELAPNAWGLYDMHGNVWEWCEDAYKEDLGTASVGDPVEREGTARVLRGGSAWEWEAACRSAFRKWAAPSFRLEFSGFRPVIPGE